MVLRRMMFSGLMRVMLVDSLMGRSHADKRGVWGIGNRERAR
jgi:hypothetical protein